MTVSNPWIEEIKTIYWPDNMYHSTWFKGLMGTVSDVKRGDRWDWVIEMFLGSIWEHSKGNFEAFVRELFRTWLEEWLHMIYRWERVKDERFLEKDDPFNFQDEEEPVRKWISLLSEEEASDGDGKVHRPV